MIEVEGRNPVVFSKSFFESFGHIWFDINNVPFNLFVFQNTFKVVLFLSFHLQSYKNLKVKLMNFFSFEKCSC